MASKTKRKPALKKVAHAPLLITSAVPGVRDSGTGFCVGAVGGDALVVTCAHVIRELDEIQNHVLVNGHQATAMRSAEDNGLDLALLRVPSFSFDVPNISLAAPSVGSGFVGAGFCHLHGGQYVSTPLCGVVADTITIQEQLALTGVLSLRLKATAETKFVPGNSGSAIYDKSGEIIGVLAYASQDGRTGYALSSPALSGFLERAGASQVSKSTQRRSVPDIINRPLPPELKPIQVRDDPQKNRFGGKKSDGKVAIDATFEGANGSSYFSFSATVKAVAKDLRLISPARFYLHDSFPRSVIQMARPDPKGGFTLSDVHSYGVFTVGCQVFASDGEWHNVEYDLVGLKGVPDVFLNR